MADSDTSSITLDEMPAKFAPEDTPMQEIMHTALQLCPDLQDTQGHNVCWHGIDSDHVAKIIPNSLYLFLSVLFGGHAVLETEDKQKMMASRQRFAALLKILFMHLLESVQRTPAAS